jgi:hypothetical protein
MQRKICVFLAGRNLMFFQFEFFVEILNLSYKMAYAGDEFSSNSSPILKTTLKQYTTAYFSTFHLKRMEDHKQLLEAEIWKNTPMPSNFTIYRMNVRIDSHRNA